MLTPLAPCRCDRVLTHHGFLTCEVSQRALLSFCLWGPGLPRLLLFSLPPLTWCLRSASAGSFPSGEGEQTPWQILNHNSLIKCHSLIPLYLGAARYFQWAVGSFLTVSPQFVQREENILPFLKNSLSTYIPSNVLIF